MRNYIARRVNNIGKYENTKLAKSFLKAILTKDIIAFENMLLEENSYFNGLCKWKSLELLKTYFDKCNEQFIEIEFDQCTSLDYYPGCLAFKIIFRYLDTDEDMPNRLVLVPIFEDRLLVDIAISKKYAPMFVLDRLMENN
jgi:hypothetical protein